jgi:ubiquinone/menaquinone biosynthesis C-methylase UbiE
MSTTPNQKAGRRLPARVTALLTLISTGCGGAKTPVADPEELARFEPSPPPVVDAMLEIARLKKEDVVYDLGCGDGRIVIAAAKRHGARGVGLDINPELIALSRQNAATEGVSDRVSFRQEDVLTADIADASVVMLFLSVRGNTKLEEKLRTRLAPGTRIVSHCHEMKGWVPDRQVTVEVEGREHVVYLWTVKAARKSENLAPFVPTPMTIVERMLEIAEVTSSDVVYDLGCGDGRIVVEAAKRYGARGVGIDIDIQRCKEARERAESAGVSRLVEIRHEDVLEADFSDATVVTLYLLTDANRRLRPKLEALRPGTRIVAHDFGIGDWKPLREEVVWVHDTDRHILYFWKLGEAGGAKPVK